MQGTNIPDLDAAIPTAEKFTVMGRIRAPIYRFFFRQLLAGDRGPRNALIVFFFHKLHQECVREFGENPTWDENNETRLMTILARMNFNEPQQQRPAASKGKTKGPKPE